MTAILGKIKKWEMELLAVGLLPLVLGLTFPYHLPLFGSYIIVLFVYAVLNKRLRIPTWTWIPYVGIVLFFVGGVYNSQAQHPLVVKDLRNLVTVSMFGLLLYSMLDSRKNFERFRNALIRLLVVFITAVSTLGIIKFLFSLKGVEFEFFRVYDGLYPWGTSLVNDTNYYSLGGVIGLTAYAYAIFGKDRYITRTKLHYIAGLIMVVNVVLAGSRRGIALLALIIAVAGGIWLYKKIRAAIRGSRKNAIILTVSAVLLLILVTTVKVRHVLGLIQPAVEVVGLDYEQFKKESAIITYRYMTMVDADLNIHDYYRHLWNEESTIDMSQIRSLNPRGIESRMVRWTLAMDIYEAHSTREKILGSGFDYMQRYEEKFSYLHHSPDYPHSHFLSALLYSGFLGLAVFIFFTLQVLFLYAKYLRNDTFFAAIFLLVFSFNLISGNTLFSGKLLTVLCLMPLAYANIFPKRA